MEKILFIYLVELYGTHKYPLFSNRYYHMGISSLSAVLKKNGHDTDVLIIDHRTSATRIKNKIKSYNPQVIGFSIDNYGVTKMLKIAHTIKCSFPSIFQVAGGVTPTLSPQIFSHSAFNALCIGEGEEALVELVDALKSKRSIKSIANISINHDGLFHSTPTRPFIQDLNSLPIIDRKLWEPYLLTSSNAQIVYIGRGCPFKCNYCANSYLQKISPGKYSRNRSVSNILLEIENLFDTYPSLSKIHLESEIFNFDLNFALEICEALQRFNSKHNFPLTFGTNIRVLPGQDYDTLFDHMSKANFEYFFVGIESGSHRIRKSILNRNYRNLDLITLAKSAHKHNLDIFTHNMIGIPTEQKRDVLKTIALNRIIESKLQALHVYTTYEYTQDQQQSDGEFKTHRDLFRTHKLQQVAILFPYLINRRKNQWLKSIIYDTAVGYLFTRKIITTYLRIKFTFAKLLKTSLFHSSEIHYGKK